MRDLLETLVAVVANATTAQDVAMIACYQAVLVLCVVIISIAINNIHGSIQSTVTNTLADMVESLGQLLGAFAVPTFIAAVLMDKFGWAL